MTNSPNIEAADRRMVVRLYDYGFTRGVEVDIAHSEELGDLLWGKGTGVHFSSELADQTPEAPVVDTDLPGALAFIAEVRAETSARYQAQQQALRKCYAQRRAA